jgi:cytochrome P450
MESIKLGDVFQYDVYTEKIVVLNSAKASLDLLDKRSGIYSDRRRSVMLGELCDRDKLVFNTRSSDPLFKDHRKMMSSGMSTRAVKKYEPIQDMQTVILLDNLLKTPENFISHMRRFVECH